MCLWLVQHENHIQESKNDTDTEDWYCIYIKGNMYSEGKGSRESHVQDCHYFRQ